MQKANQPTQNDARAPSQEMGNLSKIGSTQPTSSGKGGKTSTGKAKSITISLPKQLCGQAKARQSSLGLTVNLSPKQLEMVADGLSLLMDHKFDYEDASPEECRPILELHNRVVSNLRSRNKLTIITAEVSQDLDDAINRRLASALKARLSTSRTR